MIHSTAVIGKSATIGKNVQIGPYTVIEDHVTISENGKIGPHCHIYGSTTIGKNCDIHAGAIVGGNPQDLRYIDQETYLEIGDNCTIREYATIHRSFKPGEKTIIGNNCYLMIASHIAHDCIISDHVILGNNVQVAGHVEVGSKANIATGTMIHQFCRVGCNVITGGNLVITQDLVPYSMISQGPKLYGPNAVGLKRAGFSLECRRAIKSALKLYFFSKMSHDDALAEMEAEFPDSAEVTHLIRFIKSSKRGLIGN